MQVPLGLERIAGRNPDVVGRAILEQSGHVLSLEAQIRLRELYEYVENSRTILSEVNEDLGLFESHPEDVLHLHKASERLEQFCLEADGWGFSALYQIGMAVQVLLLDFGNRLQDNVFWNTMSRGLAMLSVLLEQCENDYRWRLAVAETLDSIDQVTRD